jgi:8-oxo-dGTP pyrophosphatase MutT (NUDIX family)
MRLISFINERSYWGTSGAGAIIQAKETGNILVLRRSRHVNEPNTLSIVASGAIDSGERPLQAAIREMKEELKYEGEILSRKLIDVFTDIDELGYTFKFYTFKFVIPKEFEPTLNWETDKFFWWNGKDKLNGKFHFGTERLLKNKRGVIFK